MLDEKLRIKNAFNRATTTYDRHCELQQQTGRTLLLLMQKTGQSATHLIDLGCGTGIVTEEVIQHYKPSRIHALDMAQDMLQETKRRLSAYPIHLDEADFDALPTYPYAFDIVFSNMALQWSNQLSNTLRAIANALTDNGVLAFSLPLDGTLIELQPHFSRRTFLSANSIKQLLETAGYRLQQCQTETKQFHFPTTRSALTSLKQIGATITSTPTARRYLGKAILKQCELKQLTYEIGYFIATKKT